MARIVSDISDEAIEKSLIDHKYMLDFDEKSYVDLTMMYTNGELEFVCVERDVNFYHCDYSVLPKGHGRLIDADALKDTYARAGLVGYEEEIQAIDDSPTVIEADKEIVETAEEIVLRQARIGDALAKGIRAGLIEGLNGSSS